MSKYNEQHATTMLNALQGTDTLKQYAEQIRADERAKVLEIIDWLIDSDYNSKEFKLFWSDLLEYLKEQKNE